MSKVSTNISLDADLKKESQELYSDLGMDLSTAVTIFLKQSLRVQGIPFTITRENPNAETIAAMNEYYEMKAHPEKYKRVLFVPQCNEGCVGGQGCLMSFYPITSKKI
jgi:DNA-damage-inducible protein J